VQKYFSVDLKWKVWSKLFSKITLNVSKLLPQADTELEAGSTIIIHW